MKKGRKRQLDEYDAMLIEKAAFLRENNLGEVFHAKIVSFI